MTWSPRGTQRSDELFFVIYPHAMGLIKLKCYSRNSLLLSTVHLDVTNVSTQRVRLLSPSPGTTISIYLIFARESEESVASISIGHYDSLGRVFLTKEFSFWTIPDSERRMHRITAMSQNNFTLRHRRFFSFLLVIQFFLRWFVNRERESFSVPTRTERKSM